MGFLRKTFIIGTAGLGRAVVNPNSKKARILRASERQLDVDIELGAQEAAYRRQVLRLLETPAQPRPDAGWYPDPTGRYPKRWWDGSQWADRVVDTSGEYHDPL